MVFVAAVPLTPLPSNFTAALCPPIAIPAGKLLPCYRNVLLHIVPPFFATPFRRSNAEKPPFSISASRWRRGEMGSGGDAGSNGDEWEEAEEEGEPLLPFEEMRRWERNRPAGFGEGKTYDTTVEDRLLKEMEQNSMVQIAENKKLESNPNKSLRPNKQEQHQKALDFIPRGIHIRLGNLPKKKNIHRDLQMAFKGFTGIVKISPAVIRNRKTRDPICKGFAFLELESEKAAQRFVQIYSKQNVPFGKVHKEITCEIMHPCCTANSPSQVAANTQTFTLPKFANLGGDMATKSDMESHSIEGSISPVIVNEPKEFMSHSKGETDMGIEHLNFPLSNGAENGRPNPMPSSQKQRKPTASKKKMARVVKTSKLSLPSTMSRLKIKERTVLAGVFSKYGGKADSASLEPR